MPFPPVPPGSMENVWNRASYKRRKFYNHKFLITHWRQVAVFEGTLAPTVERVRKNPQWGWEFQINPSSKYLGNVGHSLQYGAIFFGELKNFRGVFTATCYNEAWLGRVVPSQQGRTEGIRTFLWFSHKGDPAPFVRQRVGQVHTGVNSLGLGDISDRSSVMIYTHKHTTLS